MNTRSTSAFRKRHMTIDFHSRHAENTSCVPVSKSNVDVGVIDENSSGECDLKNIPDDGLCHEDDTRCKNNDQVFEGKDDSTFTSGVTTRSSSRPGKRPRTVSPQRSLSTTPEPAKSGKIIRSRRKPQKRQWESWGPKEKDCFFEALSEHSKDFDKIHHYLLNKHKRRGDLSAVVKKKDQVRFFYYRTLNKISKYVPEPQDNQDSKKTYHEVRSLICYGELRKKLHSLNEKNGKKLIELISTGKTTVRHHGRNLNVRAPVCRALKKLCSTVVVEDPAEHVPNKIMIELVPKDNKTWSTIQGLAQNPRLRTTLSSRKSVYSLLKYLISKWKLCDNTNITLSPILPSSPPQLMSSKGNELETKSKLCEGSNDCMGELEQVSDSCVGVKESICAVQKSSHVVQDSAGAVKESIGAGKKSAGVVKESVGAVKESAGAVKDSADATCTVITETINVTTSIASNENQVLNNEFESSYDLREENTERSNFHNVLYQEKWDMSNCRNTTIADVYRKLGHPRKVSFCYSLCIREGKTSPLITCHALEYLVKIAAGEFSSRTDVKIGTKKDPVNISSKTKSVSKDSTAVSKPNRTPKSATKSAMKPPKLAPKPFQEPSLVIPSVVSSVLNQVSTSAGSSKSGNHLTFGFTPINSFQSPSPFLPKMKKSRKSRVVVQRTLLPRPFTGVVNALGKGSATLFAPSPTGFANSRRVSTDGVSLGQTSVTTFSQSQTSSPGGEIQPMQTDGQDPAPYSRFTLASSQNSSGEFSVDSLINLALEPDGNVEKLISTKSHSSSSVVERCSKNLFERHVGDIRTEEIECGVAGGTPKVLTSLTEAIEHLENDKERHSVEHTQDLLDSLRSSEDEDPFKLLSPPHDQHQETTWLNEESSDFSLSNLFGNMESSPSKQKNGSILDTPKKNQSEPKGTESHQDTRDNASKYSHPGQVFCDIVDESSVDYVKKFRDLAKKMTNDSETVSNSFDIADSLPSNNTTVSFKALLSDATSRD